PAARGIARGHGGAGLRRGAGDRGGGLLPPPQLQALMTAWGAVVLGAAPSLFLLVFFYLKDRYEPEPRGHVALAFVKGMASFVPALGAAHGLELWVGRTWLAL